MDASLTQAKYHISATASWMFAIFSRVPKAAKPFEPPAQAAKDPVPSSTASARNSAARGAITARSGVRKPGVGDSDDDMFEAAYDASLDHVAAGVQHMRAQAEQLGQALDASNGQLAQLQEDLDRTHVSLGRQTGRIQTLLH